jgi:hypothetical protein
VPFRNLQTLARNSVLDCPAATYRNMSMVLPAPCVIY